MLKCTFPRGYKYNLFIQLQIFYTVQHLPMWSWSGCCYWILKFLCCGVWLISAISTVVCLELHEHLYLEVSFPTLFFLVSHGNKSWRLKTTQKCLIVYMEEVCMEILNVRKALHFAFKAVAISKHQSLSSSEVL